MKCLGSLIIILSFAFIGRLSSSKTVKRVKYIKMMMEFLEYFKNEIMYNMVSLLELSNKLSKDLYFKKIGIFDNLYMYLLDNRSINNAWNEAVKNSVICDILSKEDIDEIKKIGSWLGDSSVEGQISNINLSSQFLKQRLSKAQSDRDRYFKIYNSFGVLIGIAIVIFIW